MALPLLKSNLNTPKIIWHQTDGIVCLQIQLVDVKNFYLRIDRDRLSFSTLMSDKKYYAIINFFGAVIPEKSMHKNTGREIRVYIPKAHIGAAWLRLYLEQEKIPMIIANPDRVLKPEWKKPLPWNVNTDSFQEYKRINKIDNIPPDEPYSEEEASDDDFYDTWFDS